MKSREDVPRRDDADEHRHQAAPEASNSFALVDEVERVEGASADRLRVDDRSPAGSVGAL